MTEFMIISAILIGVAILVIDKLVQYAKAHPDNSLVQRGESKLPQSVESALGLPAVTGDHIVQAVQAVGNSIAQVVAALPTPAPAPGLTALPVLPPGVQSTGNVDGDRLLAAYLGAGSLPVPVQPSAPAPATDPRKIYYDHNTFVAADGPYTTEALKAGPNSISLTYTSQEPGHVAPNEAWMSEDDGVTWQGPAMAQSQAVFQLSAPAGTPLLFKFDTDGRMQAQLRNF